jgi:hypothetical protein
MLIQVPVTQILTLYIKKDRIIDDKRSNEILKIIGLRLHSLNQT